MAKKNCKLPSNKTVEHDFFNNEQYMLSLLEEIRACSCNTGNDVPTFVRIDDNVVGVVSGAKSVSFYNAGSEVLVLGTPLRSGESLVFAAETHRTLTAISYDTTGAATVDLMITTVK